MLLKILKSEQKLFIIKENLLLKRKLKEKVLLAKPSVIVDMSRHILFPIPQREINVNPNLVQNPGY